MDPFQLAGETVLDIDSIWRFLLDREGLETADRIVTELFKSFELLARVPNCGHRRPDLTKRDLLFYKAFSFLIIYQPASRPLAFLGVVHGKRDVARLLGLR